MKRFLILVLVLALALPLVPTVRAEEAGLFHFVRKNAYSEGQFSDVAATDWYADNVRSAYELGLMKGQGAGLFGVNAPLTVAEAVALAARLHSIYNGAGDSFDQGAPWYQVYVDYAKAHGILDSDYPDYVQPIYRGDFAYIISRTLPNTAIPPVNTVEDHAIPDIPTASYLYDAVYQLYRAGVLTGNDDKGTFAPMTNITRSSVAAIVTRMVDASQRQSLSLSAEQVELYAPDGTSATVWSNEVAEHLASGWSQTKQVVLATDLALNQTELYLETGMSYTLEATVTPSYAADRYVGWSTSDPSVAVVNDGVVTGVGEGSAVITAVTTDGPSQTCAVFVTKAPPISAPLDTYFGFCFAKNSANGIKLCWEAKNNSGKTINYYSITCYFYNSVGDPAYDEIKGTPYRTVNYVGPVAPGGTLVIFGLIGYVPVCSKITLGEVTLTYSDGTSETFWYGQSTSKRNKSIL